MFFSNKYKCLPDVLHNADQSLLRADFLELGVKQLLNQASLFRIGAFNKYLIKY